jgi:hypothetical protein
MIAKHFLLDNLSNQTKIRVSSQTIDFLKNCTHVLVYLDDSKEPNETFFAEQYINRNNQTQTKCFDIQIPSNTKRTNIVLISITDSLMDDVLMTAS